MNRYVKYVAMTLTALTALSGCIRDDIGPCPPINVVLSVKDRMYDNSETEGYDDPHKFSTEFRQLVPTLYYVLRDNNTGQTIAEQPVSTVQHSEATHNISFDESLPFGQYQLTVWGALPDANHLEDNSNIYNLEGLDHELFLYSQIIDYNYDGAKVEGQLERVNGIVVVETVWDTFPTGIDTSTLKFTNLRAAVNNNFEYGNEQNIDVVNSITTSADLNSINVLPPSVRENGTKLNLRYYNSNHPEIRGFEGPEMYFTVHRNQVKRIRIEFEAHTKQVIIKEIVNGQWQKVEGMKVD